MIKKNILANAQYYLSTQLEKIPCVDLAFLIQIEKSIIVFVMYSGDLSEEQDEEIECAYTEVIACFDSDFFDEGGRVELVVVDQKNPNALSMQNGIDLMMLYRKNL
jgi:hypothetical protein